MSSAHDGGVVLTGTDAPLAEGELVVLVDRKGRRYLVELLAEGEWHSHAGMVAHSALIGAVEGTAVRTSKNMEITVLRPTRQEFTLKMKRGAQVVYTKDQAMIVAAADIRPGCIVAEAGAGSGALSLALLDAVGPAGRVLSYERRADHLAVARRNVTRFHGAEPSNWELHEQDLVEALPQLRVHRVVLDLLEPWLAVDACGQALAPGGIVVAYMPSVPQVMRLTERLEADGRFARTETTETLVRSWDVSGLAVRPGHRMVAHTAFITTARRVPAAEEGGPSRARSTSGGPGLRWDDG